MFSATDLPDDEASLIDERYHDDEAAHYDSYSEIPRVAAAENWILPWIAERTGSGVVVDLGCGTGRVTEHLANDTRRVIAVDRSQNMLERVRAKVSGDDVLFLRSDARRLPLGDGTVDAVVCSGVLHHIPDWQSCVADLARVLKPGGRLIVREPSARYPAWLFAPVEQAIEFSASMVRRAAPEPAGEGPDTEFSPVETSVSIPELTRCAAAHGLRGEWDGSAMTFGSIGLPDEVPFQRAYFKLANVADRALLKFTRQPFGALALAVFVRER
jgi:ubiquinone/menaquinone biosynthesis C-methylase UbiE